MVTLRDLTWPHFAHINRSKTSLISTTNSKSSSVPDQVLYGEAHPQQIETFGGPVRSVSIVRRQAESTYKPCCAKFESSPGTSWSYKRSDAMAGPSTYPHFTTAEEQGLYRPYAGLPTPPDGSGEDIGVDINPHFPPDPRSIDCCSVCGYDEERRGSLPPLPDTPLGIAKFGFISRESFNTSVRGLIQEDPDSPIGGYWSAPMNSRMISGVEGLGREHLEGAHRSTRPLPHIEVTSPPTSLSNGEHPARRPLFLRSPLSDSFIGANKKGKQVQRTDVSDSDTAESVYTTAMVTAHETPVRRENTDMGHDGARASNADNSNENESDPTAVCCTPTGHVDLEDVEVYNLNGMPREGSKSYMQQTAFGTKSINLPDTGYGLSGNVPNTSTRITRTDFANRKQGPEPPSMNGLPTSALRNLNGSPSVPAPNIITPGVPLDATGTLPAPATPKRNTRRKTVTNKGKVGVRKCRRLVMRKPLLVLILGRQLAGPTKDALKLISKGVPVKPDMEGLSEAAGIPAPGPPLSVPI